MKRKEAGFSSLELMLVIALGIVCLSVSIIPIRTTIAMLDADKASNLVVSQLGYARQLAVDQRRNYRVAFVSTNRITVTRLESGGGTTVISDVTLPPGYGYGKPTGVGDTPDGFGNATAVYFNAGTSGTFLGDGTFVDNAGVLLNGSVFTIGTGNGSARAVTLAGSAGKIKRYWLQGTNWVVE